MFGLTSLVAAFLMGILQDSSKQEPNTLSEKEKKDGWKLLFNGKTTEGWRGFKKKEMPKGWQAVDGALTRVEAAGDIITVDQFDNFELVFDWKVTDATNSGVMYRVTEEEGYPWRTGPEYQILDNKKHADGKQAITSAASCYAVYAPTKDVTKPVGEWNQGKIVCNGNHVEHWLNGEKVVEYEFGSDDWKKRVAACKFKDMPKYGKASKGHIDFQDHGDWVAYRNIKIRVLNEKKDK